MQANNVYEHLTAKWDALKRLHDEEQKHHAAARATWPEIARRMAELRATYRSNEDFGAELVKHGIEYGKDDRAAFVWMGQIKPEALEDALARCARRSPQTFRIEVQSWGDAYFEPMFSEAKKTPANTDITAEQAENAPIDPSTAKPRSAEGTKPESAMATARVDSRSALAHVAPEIAAAFLAAIAGDLKHPGYSVVRALLQIKPARPFVQWWAQKLIHHTARAPLAKTATRLDATHIVAGLHASFRDYRCVYDGAFHRKAADMLMDEFTELLDAARDGLVLAEYQRKRHASRAGAVQQHAGLPWEHKLPQRQISSEGLPDAAELRDGTRLHPAPIAVCGVQHFPSLNYGSIGYEDALTFAHLARTHVVEPRLSAGKDHKDIGLEVALMGTHLVGRQFPEAGRLLSAIGQSLRSRGGDIDPALWFSMEPLPPKTSA